MMVERTKIGHLPTAYVGSGGKRLIAGISSKISRKGRNAHASLRPNTPLTIQPERTTFAHPLTTDEKNFCRLALFAAVHC
jgi:hypothetical protein